MTRSGDQSRLSHSTPRLEAHEHRQSAEGAKVNAVANSTMHRLRGDRQSLLAALASHWVDQQIGVVASSTAAEIILVRIKPATDAYAKHHLLDGQRQAKRSS